MAGPTRFSKWAGLVGSDVDLGLTPILPMPPKPNATTWVMRDQEGQMVPIKVTDMSDAHLYRWVQYFRRKYRETPGHANLPDLVIDSNLRVTMVTAPAIYTEIAKRGIPLGVPLDSDQATTSTPTSKPVPQPGVRRIDLDED